MEHMSFFAIYFYILLHLIFEVILSQVNDMFLKQPLRFVLVMLPVKRNS